MARRRAVPWRSPHPRRSRPPRRRLCRIPVRWPAEHRPRPRWPPGRRRAFPFRAFPVSRCPA
ncbi:hypothetical protein FZ046_23865 [Mycolicibacterium grossiae]|nr:hypothetical protein FZ046_23865 [Mycolicibacterium grossiae]